MGGRLGKCVRSGRRQVRTQAPAGQAGVGEGDERSAGGRRPGEERGRGGRRAGGRGGLPFVAQEYVVEIVVDDEQLLRQLLVGDAGDELQDPLLHGAARPVELLRKEGRQPWPPDPDQANTNGRLRPLGVPWRTEKLPDWISSSAGQRPGFNTAKCSTQTLSTQGTTHTGCPCVNPAHLLHNHSHPRGPGL